MSQKPKKPKWSSSIIVFTKSGKVYPKVEYPPDTQEEQEIFIVEKLLGSLKRKNSISKFKNVVEGENNEDDVIADVDGVKIKIQVTSAVDIISRKLDIMRRDYAIEIYKSKKIEKLFQGYILNITDTGNKPFLPKIKSREGKLVLEEIQRALITLGKSLNSLPDGKMRSRAFSFGKNRIKLWFLIERRKGISFQIEFGGGRTFLKNEKTEPVLDAIKKKMKYPISNNLWLLVYMEQYFPLEDEEKDKIKYFLANMIKKNRMPFNKIYLFFPSPNRKDGILHELFPTKG